MHCRRYNALVEAPYMAVLSVVRICVELNATVFVDSKDEKSNVLSALLFLRVLLRRGWIGKLTAVT